MSQEKEKVQNTKCYFNTRVSPTKNSRAKYPKKDEKITIKPSEEDEYRDLAYETLNEPNQDINLNRTKFRSGDTRDFKTKWKTEICRFWNLNGQCKYGDNCAFAHGENEMKKRKMSASYKTKQCKQFFETGYCSYGIRCQFSHKAPEKPHVSYLKILNDFNNEKGNEQLMKRPRLKTFEDLFHANVNGKGNGSASVGDIEQNKKLVCEDIDALQLTINSFDTKDNEEKVKDEEENYNDNVNEVEKDKRKRYSSA